MHQGELFEQFSLLFYYFGLFWFVYSTHTYSTYMTYIYIYYLDKLCPAHNTVELSVGKSQDVCPVSLL
jgi:hypothetical protein